MSHPASDLGSGDEKVKKVDVRKFLTPGYTTSGHVELYTVRMTEGGKKMTIYNLLLRTIVNNA